jgi:hypothetical protein
LTIDVKTAPWRENSGISRGIPWVEPNVCQWYAVRHGRESWVRRTRKQDPSGEEKIASGSDGSGKEAGLLSVRNVDPDLNVFKFAPELQRDEGKDAGSRTGVHQNYFLFPADKSYV